MKEQIQQLLLVQSKDIEINFLEKELKQLPEELESFKQNVSLAEGELQKKQEELKKLQVERKEQEVELASKEENIKKCETQLFQVKTNEEYKAMQKQIQDLKFECGLLEDTILETMEKIDKIYAEVKEKEEKVKQEKSVLSQKEKETQEKISEIKSKIENLKNERAKVAENVEPELLSRYERIFTNKMDVAVVPVHNNACGGCHMKLPPNVVNEVIKSKTGIICENCSRIMYWPEE